MIIHRACLSGLFEAGSITFALVLLAPTPAGASVTSVYDDGVQCQFISGYTASMAPPNLAPAVCVQLSIQRGSTDGLLHTTPSAYTISTSSNAHRIAGGI